MGVAVERRTAADVAERRTSAATAACRAAAPLTGRYESYRGVQSAAVERTGSELQVDRDTPLGTETRRFVPGSLDPAEREFVAVEDDGERTTAGFFVGDDGVELLVDRVLFRRVGAADGEG